MLKWTLKSKLVLQHYKRAQILSYMSQVYLYQMVTCIFRKEVSISLNPVTAIRFVLYRGLRSNFMVYHQICDWSSNYHAYTFNEAYLLDSAATTNGKNPCSNHESNFLRNRLLLFSGFVLLILFRFHCLLEAVFTFL
jgi:hypothetical protein